MNAANKSDQAGAKELLPKIFNKLPTIVKMWADSTYGGSLIDWLALRFDVELEIVRRPKGEKGFILLPRRWVVERSIAWLGRYRRLSKDYEQSKYSSEGMIYLASIRRLLRHAAA